ncbi:MAG: 4-hydroxythreonine-4-phosphate dehydrogenase PdxA [Proteobacteria bacterium]|nr:4-hydroxythreonine-4-phosphate dehydrogenase PdxA [Pseudomonadota bacterium]MBU1710993.1 4-hydroxythreonine-4-phosphate dehydrogenase PdxA [Pseudomonadota bacterium]
MGCPVGIGPEIILKFLSATNNARSFQAVVLGDLNVLEACAAGLGIDAEIVPWQPGREINPRAVNVFAGSDFDPQRLTMGKPGYETGRAMAGYIEHAVEMLRHSEISAMVTCPITKKALQEAGINFPGHTEMLASLCNCDEYAMMMAGKKLRVVLVTIHCPYRSVPGLLAKNTITRIIHITHESLQRDFGIIAPKIAVAGLNPHGGEHGMFGDEESTLISPAIEESVALGMNVSGPFPPDTVFYRAASGEFDAVVSMYHDQGLIPFKLLHFADGVNVTLGLPIVRTSVDHGTAYDIAGKGVADPSSLAAAFETATAIITNRRIHTSGAQ